MGIFKKALGPRSLEQFYSALDLYILNIDERPSGYSHAHIHSETLQKSFDMDSCVKHIIKITSLKTKMYVCPVL